MYVYLPYVNLDINQKESEYRRFDGTWIFLFGSVKGILVSVFGVVAGLWIGCLELWPGFGLVVWSCGRALVWLLGVVAGIEFPDFLENFKINRMEKRGFIRFFVSF